MVNNWSYEHGYSWSLMMSTSDEWWFCSVTKTNWFTILLVYMDNDLNLKCVELYIT